MWQTSCVASEVPARFVQVMFCGIPAVRKIFWNDQFWPVPVLHEMLIKEFANRRESILNGHPGFLASCRF
jgi:hypothetical protein